MKNDCDIKRTSSKHDDSHIDVRSRFSLLSFFFFFKAFKNSFDQGLASEIGPSPGELIVLVINLSIALGASHKKMDAWNSAFSTSMFNIDRSILRRDIKGLNVKFHAPFTFIFQPSIVFRRRVQISRKNDVD